MRELGQRLCAAAVIRIEEKVAKVTRARHGELANVQE
jgi:hypothetical protein